MPSGGGADDTGRHFIHAFAHDLRQHLRTISVSAQRIQRHAGASLDPVIAERLDEVLAAVKRQEHLISSAVDFGEATDAPSPSTMPLSLVLQTSCLKVEEYRKQQGGHVHIETSSIPAVKVPAGLAKAFERILHNGLKFAPEGQPPQVFVVADLDLPNLEPGIVRIQFRDQGVGIEPEYRQRVFEPFQKLLPSAYPGSGMGLSIARNIIQAAGGRIAIEDGVNGGITVTVELPYQA